MISDTIFCNDRSASTSWMKLIMAGGILNTGELESYKPNNLYGIRPVINLSKNVTLSGDGTYGNVYIVS